MPTPSTTAQLPHLVPTGSGTAPLACAANGAAELQASAQVVPAVGYPLDRQVRCAERGLRRQHAQMVAACAAPGPAQAVRAEREDGCLQC